MPRIVMTAILALTLATGCARKNEAPDTTPTEGATEDASAESSEGSAPDEATPAAPEALPAPEDVAAPPADAQRTPSGLATKVLRAGSGDATPGPRDVVEVHYTGWTTDGEMFDSSVVRGESISFPLNKVIKGWQEGVMLMTVGEKRRLWIPEELAYQGKQGYPAGMLVFDVELIAIQPAP